MEFRIKYVRKREDNSVAFVLDRKTLAILKEKLIPYLNEQIYLAQQKGGFWAFLGGFGSMALPYLQNYLQMLAQLEEVTIPVGKVNIILKIKEGR